MITIGDIVEYLKEEYQVKDKDRAGRLFIKRLSDGRTALTHERQVYFLRKTVEELEE